MACGQNPIPIIIPCHRVIGKNGKLTGFSGGEGIETKRYLLDLEETDKNLSLPF
jgi:methylated-DNA-[protein]-cysteine S-methyltransferase